MSDAPSLSAGLMAMKQWSGVAALAAIRSETLILWGESDRAYLWEQIERLWREIPVSHLAVVPACSHAVHLERPALFNQLVCEFLSAAHRVS